MSGVRRGLLDERTDEGQEDAGRGGDLLILRPIIALLCLILGLGTILIGLIAIVKRTEIGWAKLALLYGGVLTVASHFLFSG